MMSRLLRTPPDPTLTYLRLALGLILLPHGAQKLLGFFGGLGYRGTVDAFASQLGIPPFVTLLVVATEFFGALSLVLGLAGRLASVALAANMLGAILVVNADNGFFWTQGGFEFPLLILLLALVIAVRGSGAYSLDRRLSRTPGSSRRLAPG